MDASKLLPRTGRGLRLNHKLFVTRSQSHPRRIPGALTVPHMARALEVAPHWLYARINKGTIQVSRHQATGLYLFPDTPATREQLQQLKIGTLHQVGLERTSTNPERARRGKLKELLA